MKKNLSRVLAVILILIVLCGTATLFVSAADAKIVNFLYSYYSPGNYQGAIPYGYSTWTELLANYYTDSSYDVYYFELQNTIYGGTRFIPSSYTTAWQLAYQFDQTDFGIGNPIYKFYVPWNNGRGWDFQIKLTNTGNVAFDSTAANFVQDPYNVNRGYYMIEIDRNMLGWTNGWYIYSLTQPPQPESTLGRVTITYNYYLASNHEVLVGTKFENPYYADNVVELSVPSIDGYYTVDAAGPGYFVGTLSGNYFVFNSLTRDYVINVYVKSINDFINESAPAQLIFTYSTVDNPDVPLNITYSLSVASGVPITIPAPLPPGYVFSNMGTSNDGVNTNIQFADIPALSPREVRYFEVRVMPLEDFEDEVVKDWLDSRQGQQLVEGAYRSGYEDAIQNGGGTVIQTPSNPLLYLVEPVASFLNLEVYPGFSLGILFMAMIGLTLVIVFLKIFAGG